MIVYLDIVLASTFIVNFAFLKTISLIDKKHISTLLIIIASSVGSVSIFMFLLPYKWMFNLRYFVGIIIGLICFHNDAFKSKVIKIACFYMLNFMFIGTLVIFEIASIKTFLLALLYVLVLFIIENFQNKEFNKDVYVDDVLLHGLVDTGNSTSYKQKPVVFLKEKYLNDNFIYIGYTLCQTVQGVFNINIYKGPPLKISKSSYFVYYAFMKINNYDIILNKEIV